MANENLKRMLELSKKVSSTTTPQATARPASQLTEAEKSRYMSEFDTQVNNLDEQVYGKYHPKEGIYDADREMEILKQGPRKPAIDLAKSQLPKNIVESILNNPLDMDPTIVEGSKYHNFMNNLGKSEGLQRIAEMQEKLNGEDIKKKQAKMEERMASQSSNGNGGFVDYSLIKDIIEKVVSDKINELKKEIVEEISNNANNCTLMTFKDGFLYLTDDGKVYECNMKFKGYNKGKVQKLQK